jgi:hypothetical protein
MTSDETERKLQASMAAHLSSTQTENRTGRTAPARSALEQTGLLHR